MFSKNEPEHRASAIISRELEVARRQLQDRNAELLKAKRYVEELEVACVNLLSKVRDLEHDKRALDRGYIALMGDNASSDHVGPTGSD